MLRKSRGTAGNPPQYTRKQSAASDGCINQGTKYLSAEKLANALDLFGAHERRRVTAAFNFEHSRPGIATDRDIGLSFRVALGIGHHHADPPHSVRLLRARPERPRDCCTAEQRDEVAASHASPKAQECAKSKSKHSTARNARQGI